MRHVHAVGFAPACDHVAAAQHHAGGLTARLEGADALAERLAAEGAVVALLHVARGLVLTADGEGDRVGELDGVDAHGGRRAMLPDGGGDVGGRGRGPRPRLRRGRDGGGEEEEKGELHRIVRLGRVGVGRWEAGESGCAAWLAAARIRLTGAVAGARRSAWCAKEASASFPRRGLAIRRPWTLVQRRFTFGLAKIALLGLFMTICSD